MGARLRDDTPAADPGGGPPGIECRSLTAGYAGTPVLRDLSFRIEEPAVYVVLGPNGAGKTTLLRALSGILLPDAGEVRISGRTLGRSGAQEQVHYLSHVDGIPDGLRVREALEYYARVERAARSDVDRVIDRLQLGELSDHYTSQLSAGQRKRVSIARILLRERSIYLLDEPTSNLDPKVAGELRALILELSREKIVLYSSHNLFEAREIGRYVLAIRSGQLALFGRMDELRSAHFVIGIRTLEPSEALAGLPRQGDYYLRELSGPEEVPGLLRDLEARGAKIREVREMGNPLEDLFA